MSKEQKPDLYYFNKLVRELMEKGEVYIYGQTYKQSNSSLTIESLVQEVCDFHNDSKIDEVTRKTVELEKEISRHKKITEKQKNIVKELEFYFNEGYDSIDREQLMDMNRTKFYIDKEGLISFIYPEFPNAIYNSVVELMQDLKFKDMYDYITKATRGNGAFSELFEKIQEDDFLDIENLVSDIENRFKQFSNSYIASFSKSEDDISEEKRPLNYAFGFDRNLKWFHNDIHEYPKSINEIHVDQDTWFDENRYKRLEIIKPLIKNRNIDSWPIWTIEHVILTELEYIIVRDHLVDIIIHEINDNINFNLFTSASGMTVDVQSNISDVQILSKKLSDYRFPGGIKENVEVKRGTLIEGSFFKNPNKLTSQNKHSPDHIEFVLIEAINIYLSSIMSSTMRLDSSFQEELSGFVTERLYSSK